MRKAGREEQEQEEKEKEERKVKNQDDVKLFCQAGKKHLMNL